MIGMLDVACFAARTDGVPCVTIASTFRRTFGHELGETLVAPLGPAVLDRDIAPFYPTKFAQTLNEGGSPLPLARRRALP
jgi:hypothetical protein